MGEIDDSHPNMFRTSPEGPCLCQADEMLQSLSINSLQVDSWSCFIDDPFVHFVSAMGKHPTCGIHEDEIAYTSVLDAWASAGRTDQALKTFREIQKQRLETNSLTFNAL